MMMPGRKYSAVNGYRFSFNGQEKEKDFNENVTNALYWEYDSRIGRRWNLDPKFNAGESRYSTLGTNPITYKDPLGDFKTKFGARVHRFFNGGGKIGKNKYNEWYVAKDRGVELKENGEVVVNSAYYYGKGRDKYSTAREFLLSEADIDMDIQINGEKSKYQYYETTEEADKSALKLGTGLLLPNVLLKPLTIATNTQKILSKIDRLNIFKTRILNAPAANNADEALTLINKTMDDVEDIYSGVVKNVEMAMAGKTDGRMYGFLDDAFITRHANGNITGLTAGHRVEIQANGSFSIYSRKDGSLLLTK
ncbi:MAG: hypothetical protein EOO43_05840 [Flavobacterium sp.]|nr:MAG: hypothetical protein EOO43_05840 [Flavobacterium sp.]